MCSLCEETHITGTLTVHYWSIISIGHLIPGALFAVIMGEISVGDMPESASGSSYAFDQFQPEYKQQELKRLEYKTNVLESIDRAAWQQAGLQPDFKILDIGCGVGTVSWQLAKAVPYGAVIGVDISEAMIANASTPSVSKNLDFKIGDVYCLDFPSNSFDMVHARFLLQHLAHPLHALSELYRVLRPGGRLCVVDVDDSWFTLYPEPSSIHPFRQAILAIQKEQGGDPFVGRKLFSYFRRAGLEDVESRIRILGTADCGTQTLMGLLSFGAPYYANRPDFTAIAKQARHDVMALMQQDELWASIGIFTATGRKS